MDPLLISLAVSVTVTTIASSIAYYPMRRARKLMNKYRLDFRDYQNDPEYIKYDKIVMADRELCKQKKLNFRIVCAGISGGLKWVNFCLLLIVLSRMC